MLKSLCQINWENNMFQYSRQNFMIDYIKDCVYLSLFMQFITEAFGTVQSSLIVHTGIILKSGLILHNLFSFLLYRTILF